jgi:hypothetical protein
MSQKAAIAESIDAGAVEEAMSFAVVPGLYPHRSTALEETT